MRYQDSEALTKHLLSALVCLRNRLLWESWYTYLLEKQASMPPLSVLEVHTLLTENKYAFFKTLEQTLPLDSDAVKNRLMRWITDTPNTKQLFQQLCSLEIDHREKAFHIENALKNKIPFLTDIVLQLLKNIALNQPAFTVGKSIHLSLDTLTPGIPCNPIIQHNITHATGLICLLLWWWTCYQFRIQQLLLGEIISTCTMMLCNIFFTQYAPHHAIMWLTRKEYFTLMMMLSLTVMMAFYQEGCNLMVYTKTVLQCGLIWCLPFMLNKVAQSSGTTLNAALQLLSTYTGTRLFNWMWPFIADTYFAPSADILLRNPAACNAHPRSCKKAAFSTLSLTGLETEKEIRQHVRHLLWDSSPDRASNKTAARAVMEGILNARDVLWRR